MNVFIDTNILLDVIAQRDQYYAPAAELWTHVEIGRIKAAISAISFNNTFYLVRRWTDQAEAFRALKLLRQIFHVVALDQTIIDLALDSQILDFEDAVQFHSARRSRSEFLITRNQKDYPKGRPEILTADEFLDRFKSSGRSRK